MVTQRVFDWFEDDPGREDEQDLTPIVESAVTADMAWTVDTILSQLDRGRIRLDPGFQRREAWNNKKKSTFIESLLLGVPIPEIVLAEEKESAAHYLVIDGKQRLIAIRRFTAIEGQSNLEPFALQGLEVLKHLNGRTYEDMLSDPSLSQDLARFENQVIRAVVLRSWPNDDYLYRIFYRLNSGSVPLSPQELRQALKPGPFVRFLDERAPESEGLMRILGNDEPDYRMHDVELLLRFLAYSLRLDRYRGNLKKSLDDTCAVYNRQWDVEKRRIRNMCDRGDNAIEATYEIFGEHAFRRWTGEDWDRRFNRAIFDIVTY